jgi:hypothetical protein
VTPLRRVRAAVAEAPAASVDTAAALVQAAAADTVYRDVYLDRARTLLSPMISEAEYRRLERARETSQELPLRIQRAVEQSRWAEVKDLTDRLQAIRQELASRRRVLELAHPVFAGEVTLDPFSPGLQLFTGLARAAQASLRTEAVERLAQLARADEGRRAFYEGRRRAFEALQLTASEEAAGEATVDTREAAMLALKSGDIGRVKAVAEAMLLAPAPGTPAARAPGIPAPAAAAVTTPDLSFDFSADTLGAARRLGLAARHLTAMPEMAALRAYAWHPLFSDGAQRIGVKNVPLPRGTDEGFRERLEMFMIHPVVNSGGARHLPVLGDEDVLIEDFPDPAGGPAPAGGPLLEALGLPARRGVSRDVIEQHLGRNGVRIVEQELGLDPLRFRLVCIPPDVHLRLGADEGWGRQELWTHLDGYLVMPQGRLRALAGGDVRFGGLYNLVGIGRDYDSDKVIARLAVVRRERMTAW